MCSFAWPCEVLPGSYLRIDSQSREEHTATSLDINWTEIGGIVNTSPVINKLCLKSSRSRAVVGFCGTRDMPQISSKRKGGEAKSSGMLKNPLYVSRSQRCFVIWTSFSQKQIPDRVR